MQAVLETLAEEYEVASADPDPPPVSHAQQRLTAAEYCARLTLQVAGNYDGIAAARSGKPKRQIDEDCKVKEAPVRVEGGQGDEALDAQAEGAGERARMGLGAVGESLHIGHRFSGRELENVLRFEVRERQTAFSKELCKQQLMQGGKLPDPLAVDAAHRSQELQEKIVQPYSGDGDFGQALGSLGGPELREVIEVQRKHFNQTGAEPQGCDDSDADCPPPPAIADAARPTTAVPAACFAPTDQFRRPSDVVAHQAEQFEKGLTGAPPPPGESRKTKKLTTDQVLFLAKFGHVCNTVWDEERDDMPMARRQRFSLLLMGQGGSGKTALIQDIVLPVLDLLFPAEDAFTPPQTSLIVCASWAQAENISTSEHKAVSCHNASIMCVQSLRNAKMAPGEKKSGLERKWGNKRCLVVEEVGTISPALLNMLLYRSFHGRADRWEVQEPMYDKHSGAFGRMPIVIFLGDFLQLRPTAAMSLLDDLSDAGRDVPPEFQMASKLLMTTPFCFELRKTNRFKDERLAELMAFMRAPGKKLPAHLRQHWLAMQVKDRPNQPDPRLQENRFQTGHMLAIYWETVGRWVLMRARRDAAALKTPLFLLQAADSATPPLTKENCAKLFNHYNPYETGHMHGFLAVHLGMKVRLLVPLDKQKGLVQEAEGVVVHVAVNPKDQARVDASFAQAAPTDPLYLEHVALGLWVRFDKYTGAPFQRKLRQADATLTEPLTQSLVFVEPSSTMIPFKWRGHSVYRVGFPLSHAKVRTSTSCQGKTLKGGVIIDCARREDGPHPMDDGTWWLHLYVMLSRATTLDDLLLLRAPGPAFLLQGPPKDLQKALKLFAKRVEQCRLDATALARDLGLQRFLQ